LFAVFDLFETSNAYVHVLVGVIPTAGPTAGLAMFIGTALVLRDTSECSDCGIMGGSACYKLKADQSREEGNRPETDLCLQPKLVSI
jgi:hypothetical protein